jgi:hypothetical protein
MTKMSKSGALRGVEMTDPLKSYNIVVEIILGSGINNIVSLNIDAR